MWAKFGDENQSNIKMYNIWYIKSLKDIQVGLQWLSNNKIPKTKCMKENN